MEICTVQVYTSHRHATFCNRHRMITTRALTERKPPPTPKFQAKVIRDSNTDFRIDPDPDVCRICSNTLWMHRLLGVNHFAKYGTKRPLIVWEMLTNDQKSPIPKWWKKEKKMIQNPGADPNHHQKSTTSRGSPFARAWQVWSTSVSAFISIMFTEWQNEWQTERSHNIRLVDGGNNKKICSARHSEHTAPECTHFGLFSFLKVNRRS